METPLDRQTDKCIKRTKIAKDELTDRQMDKKDMYGRRQQKTKLNLKVG